MTVLLLSPLLWPAQLQKEDDTIAWSATHRLVWSDFRGQPDDNSSDAALTSSSIEFSYNYDSRDGFRWHIRCLFDKNKSWGKVKNDYILAHEQGHFDITEIYARRLQKQFREYHFSREKGQKEVPALYQAIMKQQTETQQRYDDETDHSRVKDKQAAWLEKIKKDLEEMKAYTDYN